MNIDSHSDIALKLYAEKEAGNETLFTDFHLPRLLKSDVQIEVVTVGGDFETAGYDFSKFDITNNVIDFFKKEIKNNSKQCTLITTKKDIDDVIINNKIGFILSLEGAHSIEGSIENWMKLYDKGVRSLLLTHNKQNELATGCREELDTGLTKKGEALIQLLNTKHIILDISHISRKSFYDIFNIYTKPIIASHSGVYRIRDNFRNLDDNQIKSIAQRGGVIGLPFLSDFLSEKPKTANLSDLIKHIDYIKNLVGIDHIGLGPDFSDYFKEDLRKWLIKNNFSEDLLHYVKGCENITQYNNVRKHLQNQGYLPEEIDKIMGENMLRMYKQLLP